MLNAVQDDGSDWTSFNGQIEIHKQITVGGFKAGGLFVKVSSLAQAAMYKNTDGRAFLRTTWF